MKYTCPEMVPVLSMLCFEGQDHSGGRGQHSRIIERKYYSFYRKTGKSTKILLKLSLITDYCSLRRSPLTVGY
jgi:hypothetical protein